MWVLVRTASPNILSKTIRNVNFFPTKFSIFPTEKKSLYIAWACFRNKSEDQFSHQSSLNTLSTNFVFCLDNITPIIFKQVLFSSFYQLFNDLNRKVKSLANKMLQKVPEETIHCSCWIQKYSHKYLHKKPYTQMYKCKLQSNKI